MRITSILYRRGRRRAIRACVRRGLGAALLTTVAMAFGTQLAAQETYVPPSALKKLSVEELADIDVTSVSKYAEKFSAAAAAVSSTTTT